MYDRPINSQLTEEEIEQLIKDADSDHDGLISYEGEFSCTQVFTGVFNHAFVNARIFIMKHSV